MRPLDPNKISKILVVSLTNIGDVVLTLPVVDILKRDFPDATISIIIGPKAKTLLEGNPVFDRVHLYDKHQHPFDKLKWILYLRKQKYNLVVDLRNSAIPFMLSPKYHTPLHSGKKLNMHMKLKHLNRLKTVHPFVEESGEQNGFYISEKDQGYIDKCLGGFLNDRERFVVMAPGSADQAKRWSQKGYASLSNYLCEAYGIKTVYVGDQNDDIVVKRIQELNNCTTLNLCGKATLIQTSEIIRRSHLVVVNDSAALHIASYLDKPVIALFGYTDPNKYGPWSKHHLYFKPKQMSYNQELSTQQKIEIIESISAQDIIACLEINDHQIKLKNK